MALNYRSTDRDQPFLLPPDLRDWLPSDHLAWFILEVVKGLGTSGLHQKSKRGGIGREGYDPEMLLAVWVYASARGVSSSRQIERACTEDVAFRVLCAQDVPDHTVLARFRQSNRAVMADLFTQVLVLCVRQGLGKFGVIAIDGTKIKSNASKDKTHSLKRLRSLARGIMDTAEATDAAEDAADVPTMHDDLPAGFGPGPDRPSLIEAEIKDIEDFIAAENKSTPDTVQADASPQDGRGGGRLTRIETAITDLEGVVERENKPRLDTLESQLAAAEQRLIDREAKQAASRQRYADAIANKTPNGRPPIENNGLLRKAKHGVEFAKNNLERARQRAAQQSSGEADRTKKYLLRRNVTDPQSRIMHTRNGFFESYNGQVATADDQLILAVAVTDEPNDQYQLIPMMNKVKANVEHCKAETGRTDLGVGKVVVDNGYLSAENVAAEGYDRLIAPGRGTMKDGHWVGSIKGKKGEKISQAAQTMRTKLAEPGNQKIYNRRGVLVEPVNAHLKDRRGLRQFACRGRDAANAELHMAALATNLMKLFTTRNKVTQTAT